MHCVQSWKPRRGLRKSMRAGMQHTSFACEATPVIHPTSACLSTVYTATPSFVSIEQTRDLKLVITIMFLTRIRGIDYVLVRFSHTLAPRIRRNSYIPSDTEKSRLDYTAHPRYQSRMAKQEQKERAPCQTRTGGLRMAHI